MNLILFRNFRHDDILNAFLKIIDNNYTENDLYEALNLLIEFSSKRSFSGNLWHDYLAFVLVNTENSFTTTCEKKGFVDGSINDIAMHDFEIFMKLFKFDFNNLEMFNIIKDYKATERLDKEFNTKISEAIVNLAKKLANASDVKEFFNIVVEFYKLYGVGQYGLHKAFRVVDKCTIKSINNISPISFDDLIGYEYQKELLINNTIDFLNGKKANNVLLYGDSGTGKSSSIKALINKFYDDGLRMIEVYKHQFIELPSIISKLKDRNYKFIIYMDDLSFEDFEVEYKYLKAVIEGGLENNPDNVLIYATSNRRHLIKETFKDSEDYDNDSHRSETSEEKLSLSSRFGLSILYLSPNKSQFENIIYNLKERFNLSVDNELFEKEAKAWQMSHGYSGRSAQQFVKYISEKKA